jgi:Pyruvate/2-oxoacid:ferredoxin oxidoreductase gamma subunit
VVTAIRQTFSGKLAETNIAAATAAYDAITGASAAA